MPENVPVSFRLPEDLATRLKQVATTSGQTLSEVAREAVLAFVEQPGPADGQADANLSAKEDVARLREDLATMFATMLVVFAKQNPRDAEAWAREHLSP
ncbi:MAG: hypothetical protein AMXMBFR47_23230 [Planctomycetota bacterium]